MIETRLEQKGDTYSQRVCHGHLLICTGCLIYPTKFSKTQLKLRATYIWSNRGHTLSILQKLVVMPKNISSQDSKTSDLHISICQSQFKRQTSMWDTLYYQKTTKDIRITSYDSCITVRSLSAVHIRGVSEGGQGGNCPSTFWQNRRRRAVLLLAPPPPTSVLGSHLRPCILS